MLEGDATRRGRVDAPGDSFRHCIIGAGPAGLAQAAAFRRLGIDYDHFERHRRLGGIWDLDNPGTPMYESAHLISSKTLSGFPSFPMPEDFPDYPRRDQVLDYLERFADHAGVKGDIQLGQAVESVEPDDDGAWVSVGGERRRYASVTCATGVNWQPRLVQYAGELDGRVRHSRDYRRADELRGKRVLIVGLGNSGADIACDATRTAASVLVSVRRGYHFIPKHILGKPADVFAHEGPTLPLWLEAPLFALLQRWLVGDVTALGMPRPDHRLLESHPLMNDQLLHHLRHGDVELRGDVERYDGAEVCFAGGSRDPVDEVILATGYVRTIPYLAPDRLDDPDNAGGNFLSCFSRRYPGLFTLGFVELNGALYPHLERLAALVARYVQARENDPAVARKFRSLVTRLRVDQTRGRRLVGSERHRHYWDDDALRAAARKLEKRMGWRGPLPGA